MASKTNQIKPEVLLQNLIRFNTTNPPGNEAECIAYINNLLQDNGIETTILYQKPERPNLIARLKGQGTKPPLMMYGHVDVVTAENQDWTYPPFDGVIADGCIWGRGALDMKGAVTMMLCSMLRAKAEGFTPPGDIILCVVSDEEDGGVYGARYIAENHAELFKDVKYAIGEIGGFTMKIGDKRFYPIMVSEKQRCGIRAIFKGPGGHGSLPARNGAMAKLGAVLDTLNKSKLPVHITPPVRMMIKALASNLGFPKGAVLNMLLNPSTTDFALRLMGNGSNVFEPILHNTVNATIVHGGNKINVIPGEIVLDFDGRILPGLSPDSLLDELHALLGEAAELSLLFYDEGPDKVDMTFFDTLSKILVEGDNAGIPVPFVVSGVTDARFFAKLGIQTYGFTPMAFDEDLDFSKLLHNANERVPVKALGFGVEAIYKLIRGFN